MDRRLKTISDEYNGNPYSVKIKYEPKRKDLFLESAANPTIAQFRTKGINGAGFLLRGLIPVDE